MSRFGHDYLKVGFYTEILFSEKDVRLIAINDNIHTERGENDFAPLMNVFNEWFVNSTSKKIRTVWQANGKSGERLAVIPQYGYAGVIIGLSPKKPVNTGVLPIQSQPYRPWTGRDFVNVE